MKSLWKKSWKIFSTVDLPQNSAKLSQQHCCTSCLWGKRLRTTFATANCNFFDILIQLNKLKTMYFCVYCK